MIYLDNSATTPVKPEVVEVIKETMETVWGNPSSTYEFGLKSKRLLEQSREKIANFIGAEPDEIIFTSGACESNTMFINGLPWNYPIITTHIEHSSLLQAFENSGNDEYINVDSNGMVDVVYLEHLLDGQRIKHREDFIPAVSIILANNEIGTIQDIKYISDIVHNYGGIIHTDATQYLPLYPINVKRMGIDAMSFSGQKFGCPKGIGCLYVKKDIPLKPLIFGNQERGLRGGTENLPYIVGMAKAIELIDYDRTQYVQELRDYCIEKIMELGEKRDIKFVINGGMDNRLANNINFQIPFADNQSIMALFDTEGIVLSAGSACCSGESKPSHVLKAIGLSDDEANHSVRISLSERNTKADIDRFILSLENLVYMIHG